MWIYILSTTLKISLKTIQFTTNKTSDMLERPTTLLSNKSYREPPLSSASTKLEPTLL